MNKLIIVIALVFVSTLVYSQTPDVFRYQATIQNEAGEIMNNTNVSLRVSILSTENRIRTYAEFQQATTDDYGTFSIEIGKGNVISGDFSSIDWGTSIYFLRIEMDPSGQAEFKIISEVQLLSVPYALHAKTADNIDDADADASNEIQILSLENNTLTISQGNNVDLSSIMPATPSTDNPVPIKFRGQLIYAFPSKIEDVSSFGDMIATGATSDGDGQANSEILLQNSGGNAADICNQLTAFGFSDWYLPSRAELDAVYKQNYLLADYQLGSHWSSTETEANKAYSIDFLTGDWIEDTKNKSNYCLCIRKD